MGQRKVRGKKVLRGHEILDGSVRERQVGLPDTSTGQEGIQEPKLNMTWATEVAAHAAAHIKDGAAEIDGDKLDIDFTPASYTPTIAPAEATDLDHLTAHLGGISVELGTMLKLLTAGVGRDIQVGTITLTAGNATGSVTFPTAYSVKPKVWISQERAGAPVQNAQKENVGTTGFNVRRTAGAGAMDIDWVSLGTLP